MRKTFLALFTLIALCVQAQSTFQEFITDAINAGEKKEHQLAINLYHKALELDPGNYHVYNRISTGHYLLKNLDSAIYYCNLTLSIVPSDTAALYQRGHCYLDKREYEKALGDFTATFEGKNKMDADASFNIGKCYFGLNNMEKAIEFYKITLALEPSDKYSNYELGYCYASLAKPDKAAALKYYTEAIKQDPNYYDAYFNRGLLYAVQFKDKKKGHADLERSIEIRPRNQLSYLYNGMLYREEKILDKARSMFDKVIELYPDYALAYYERAVTWYDIGVLNMLCRDLEKAEQLGYQKATEVRKKTCK